MASRRVKIEIDDIPPSDNQVYRKRGNGFGMFMTQEGKSWKELVQWKCKGHSPVAGPVRVVIETTFDTLRRQDVHNRIKLTLDALQGFLYEDDCQIAGLQLIKLYKKGKKKTVIVAEEMEQEKSTLTVEQGAISS